MTLEQALQYLETTSRVSCPQITCDQAREIAEMMHGAQSTIDLVLLLEEGVRRGAGCCGPVIGRGTRLTQIREHIERVASGQWSKQHSDSLEDAWASRDEAKSLMLEAIRERDKALAEREEAQAKLREVERERRAEIDCGQSDLCAKPPGCQKHWAFKASELVRERNEIHARFSLFDCEDGCGCGDRHCWRPGRADTRCITCKLIDSLEETEEVRQAACGFAWDAGREMAVAENTAAFWEAQHAAQKRYHRMVAADKAEEVDRLQEQAESLRRQLDAPVEAAPDFDADDYAKPGKR